MIKNGIIGIMRIRNEEQILQDTLDSFSKIVDKIIIYDDASEDSTLEIAKKHPAVIEIIENKEWKKDRQSEETKNRQELLNCAKKYKPKWIFYSDCDERFDGNIREFLLSKEAEKIDGIRIMLFDAYMTEDDCKPYNGQGLYDFRKWFGPERRDILMIWKNKPGVAFFGKDKREPNLIFGKIITKFYCQHYGKAISVEQWERTCKYYEENFPEPYRSKWKKRKNQSIHDKSDFNNKLYLWKDVKKNPIINKNNKIGFFWSKIKYKMIKLSSF